MIEKIQTVAAYLRAQFPGLNDDDSVLIAARILQLVTPAKDR